VIGKYPAWLVLLMLCAFPVSACDLKVTGAWIREAPPGLMTLAGYARLTNTSNLPIQIVHIQSAQFTDVQMHETVVMQGVASMHAIATLDIAAYQAIEFAPGGKHFMLMGAAMTLKKGDSAVLKFKDQRGCTAQARFVVRAASE
jgi:copper(I)-binding protein